MKLQSFCYQDAVTVSAKSPEFPNQKGYFWGAGTGQWKEYALLVFPHGGGWTCDGQLPAGLRGGFVEPTYLSRTKRAEETKATHAARILLRELRDHPALQEDARLLYEAVTLL